MRKYNSIALFFVSSLLPLIDVSMVIDKTYIYLIFSLVIYLSLVLKGGNALILLSPLNFVYLYCQVSLIIGDYAFSHDLVKHVNLTNEFLNENSVNRRFVLALYEILLFFLTFYFLLNLKVFDSIVVQRVQLSSCLKRFSSFAQGSKSFIPFFTIPFVFYSYYLDTFFYSGYISHYFVLYLVVSLIVLVRSKVYYIFIVFVSLLIMIFTFYGDRREVIYFLYTSLIVYVLFFQKFKLNIFKISFIALASVLLILTTTIFRVLFYGTSGEMFVFSDFYELFMNYLDLELFTYFVVVNFDIANFYVHGLNSINAVINDFSLVSYGSTLIKGLFIFIPRSVFPLKPDSMLTIYTTFVDPNLRELGNSYPINFIAELFWNFHFLSILVIFFIGYFLHKLTVSFLYIFVFKNRKDMILMLTFVGPFLSYVRGAGIEYIVYSGFIFFGIFLMHSLQDKVLRKIFYPGVTSVSYVSH